MAITRIARLAIWRLLEQGVSKSAKCAAFHLRRRLRKLVMGGGFVAEDAAQQRRSECHAAKVVAAVCYLMET